MSTQHQIGTVFERESGIVLPLRVESTINALFNAAGEVVNDEITHKISTEHTDEDSPSCCTYDRNRMSVEST